MRTRTLPFLALLLALLCGCPTAGDDDSAGDDDAGGPTCADIVLRDQIIPLDPDGTLSQIHADATSDGDGLWLAYNTPRPDGKYQVVAARLGCDGVRTVAPVILSPDDGANHVDPTVAVSGDRVLVAWHRDDGQFPHNLSTWAAVVDGEGAVTSPAASVTLTDGGGTFEGNVWMPDAAALPGGFALAGARGNETTGVFLAYLQRLALDGTPDGDTIPLSDGSLSQLDPRVASDADGALRVAWTEGTDPTEEVRYVPLAAGSTEPASAARLLQNASPSRGPALAWGGSEFIIAGGSGSSSGPTVIETQTAPQDMELAITTSAGSGSDLEHSPVLAEGPGGPALAWYRHVSGLDNELRVGHVLPGDGSIGFLGERSAGTDIPPYAPALTHVVDDVWFVAWSEGASPDFMLQGWFFELEG